MATQDAPTVVPAAGAQPEAGNAPSEVAPVAIPEATAQVPQPIELEAESDQFETDSAYAESTSSVYTASLSEGVREYKYENGRRYHAYREGAYPLPNDETEQDRLDLLHHIWKLLLGGNLLCAPIPENPQRILDVGTGTGIWAIDAADEFPSAEVIGTDLSPIQPTWVPPNCQFQIDDAESEWTFKPGEAFDYIHARAMGGSIQDWQALYRQIYKHLKPGGWVEVQEYETWLRTNESEGTDGASGDMPDISDSAPNVQLWQSKVNEAAVKFGKKFNVGPDHKQNMIDAGFVDVVDVLHKVPVGPWAKDPKLKEVGSYELLHMLEAVEPFSIMLLPRFLGWSTEQVQVLGAGVRQDFKNSKNRLWSYFHFCYGRKPESPDAAEPEPEAEADTEAEAQPAS